MLLDNREMDNSTRQMLKSSAYQRSTLALIGIDSAAAVVLVAIIAYDAWRNRKSIAPRIGCELFQLGKRIDKSANMQGQKVACLWILSCKNSAVVLCRSNPDPMRDIHVRSSNI